MKLYSQNDNYKLYSGSMLDMLEVIEKESIDSIVTDPPYGLTSIVKRFGKEGSAPASTKNNDGSFARLSKGFMGKEWDGSGIEYNIDTWRKCYEVLKEGGYLLAFGGSRTFHRIACAIEDAGFEIRDTIMWLYGSGFPKSLNIGLALDKKMGNKREIIGYKNYGDKSKEGYNPYHATSETQKKGHILPTSNPQITRGNSKWEGWGTALKPSFEPIIVARKPFKGSLVDNVIEYGVGGININECRVETTDIRKGGSGVIGITGFSKGKQDIYTGGRFPANTILTYDETDYEEVCGGFPDTKGNGNIRHNNNNGKNYNCYSNYGNCDTKGYEDSGSASRYFYCAKASKKDRDEGLDAHFGSGDVEERFTTKLKNTHPTVKPTELMQYLIRLVSPNGATILDPFNGSGSTGKAVMYENKERNKNYKYIGIELTEEYLPISKARIEYVCNLEPEKDNQTSIFDFIGEE